jgi:hypothetical protein
VSQHGGRSAQWARNSLREEGLVHDDIMLAQLQHTPLSVWEITDKGRQWLRAADRSGKTDELGIASVYPFTQFTQYLRSWAGVRRHPLQRVSGTPEARRVPSATGRGAERQVDAFPATPIGELVPQIPKARPLRFADPTGKGGVISLSTTAQPCNRCLGVGWMCSAVPSRTRARVHYSAASRRGGPREQRSYTELLDKPCWNRYDGSRRYRRTSVTSTAGRLTPSPPANSYG